MSDLTRHRFIRDEAAAEDPTAACVVERHDFTGLGHEPVAEALAITIYQARPKWAFARAWLQAFLANS